MVYRKDGIFFELVIDLQGDGVLVAVGKMFSSGEIILDTENNREAVWIRIHCGKNFFIFESIYIPPTLSIEVYRHYANLSKRSYVHFWRP